MLLPQLPPDNLLALGQYLVNARRDSVERGRAYGQHDLDGVLGDEALRPDPVWMAIRKVGTLRSLTALATRIGTAFGGRAPRRDVDCIPERRI